MKRIFIIPILFLLTITMYSQTPITIEADDLPIPTSTYNYDNLINIIAPPAISENGTWDYGNKFGNNLSSFDYFPELDTLFSNQGVDVYSTGFKSLTPNLGYNVYYEYDFSDDAVEDKMMFVAGQSYGLGAISGNTKDSLLIPTQAWFWGNPRTLVKFPFTNKSSWSSVSYREMDFYLNVAAAGLNKAPGNHIYYLIRTDTIVGYGKMKLYTPNGPSIAYDVLIDKISQFAIDSFYLNGVPAPPLILNAFGISQGQVTDINNRYNFYRKGSYSYLMSVAYGSNNFTTPVNIFVNTDDLNTTSTSDESESFSTVLYPNPLSGQQLNLIVTGKDVSKLKYSIIDLTGRTLQTGQIIDHNGSIGINLDASLQNGHYILNVLDPINQPIITEQFTIAR